ncbi:MAG: precorrin-8X methylmutase [Verrucomicrobiota bacterium]|nr:precorrin-8X methylmutase [Verrucomicrobiota bacterium]
MKEAGVRFAPDEHAVVRRVVHATADASFMDTIRFAPGAVTRGVKAMRAKRPIICDARMLAAGCTHASDNVVCAIQDPEVIATAKKEGITRAAAAMRCFGNRLAGAVVAIGNAPTALRTIMEMAAQGGPMPALVIGMPVGFVGAKESKLALSRSNLPFITNLSSRGGSPAAAAAVNALADLAKRHNAQILRARRAKFRREQVERSARMKRKERERSRTRRVSASRIARNRRC